MEIGDLKGAVATTILKGSKSSETKKILPQMCFGGTNWRPEIRLRSHATQTQA